MAKIRFQQPIAILVGLGFPRLVEDVLDAYQVLNEWSPHGRGPSHSLALKTCEAVLAGRALTRSARHAFESFAAERGILIRPAAVPLARPDRTAA